VAGKEVNSRLLPQSAGVSLADEIERAMRHGQYAPGSLLALESELQTRHATGRSVVRQAIRILVQRGVVYTRRGKGGGLVVAEPHPGSASRALSIVLESKAANIGDVARLLKVTDEHLFSNCVTRVALAECERLRSLANRLDGMTDDEFLRVGGHRQLQIALRRAFGHPAESLTQQTCMDCGIDLIPYSVSLAEESRRGEFWGLMLQMVEALIAGDSSGMLELRLRQRQLFEGKFTAASGSTQEAQPEAPGSSARLNALSSEQEQSGETSAERLTREILREIRHLGWKAGNRIGGVEDLMQRYDASPGVLRQAVRMLEEYGAVQMQRGRHGGLLIAIPDEARAVQRAVGYLRMAGARPKDVHLYLFQLLLDSLSQEAGGAEPEAVAALAAVIEPSGSRGPPQPSFSRDLYLAISRLSRNPAMHLIVRVLIECMQPSDLSVPKPASAQALDEMLKSYKAHDIPKARRALLGYANQVIAAPSARELTSDE
jgi:DNA-binding FadR family transcriptional regulator